MPELLEKRFLFLPAIIVIIILNSKQSFLFVGMLVCWYASRPQHCQASRPQHCQRCFPIGFRNIVIWSHLAGPFSKIPWILRRLCCMRANNPILQSHFRTPWWHLASESISSVCCHLGAELTFSSVPEKQLATWGILIALSWAKQVLIIWYHNKVRIVYFHSSPGMNSKRIWKGEIQSPGNERSGSPIHCPHLL